MIQTVLSRVLICTLNHELKNVVNCVFNVTCRAVLSDFSIVLFTIAMHWLFYLSSYIRKTLFRRQILKLTLKDRVFDSATLSL